MPSVATLSASSAILKLRYPDGRLPKALYDKGKFKFFGLVQKREDWTGDNRQVALMNENPQGISADYSTALGSMAQGTYNKFSVPRVEYFGVARIKGQALAAAQGNPGALTDLWKTETDQVTFQLQQDLEALAFGLGDGIFGRISSGSTVSSASVTLATVEDAAKFTLGMRVQAVSTTGLSPTVRAGYATISGVDRVAGTLTVSTTWSGQVPTVTAGDYLVRAGNAASSGTGVVPTGTKGWVPGGSSPGTLHGLPRNSDPVRLAGQQYDATGVPYEEALVEASARVAQQGAPQPEIAICHPRDIANFKKAIGSKVTYPRTAVPSQMAGVSFTGIEVEGDESKIALMASPFVGRNECHMLSADSWVIDSTGPAPHMLQYDGPNFLRVASDDAYEVRFGMYGNYICNLPFANIIVTNFGA